MGFPIESLCRKVPFKRAHSDGSIHMLQDLWEVVARRTLFLGLPSPTACVLNLAIQCQWAHSETSPLREENLKLLGAELHARVRKDVLGLDELELGGLGLVGVF